MKEKTKLRIIQILCVCSILITVFSIQRTYAKYFEKVDTNYSTGMKKWILKLNNSEIHQNKDLSKIMQPVLVENEHMDKDVLVPGREGYFNFDINYSQVDLPFRFQFDIKQLDENNQLTDFQIYGYKIIDGTNIQQIDIENLKDINIKIDPNTEQIFINNEPQGFINQLNNDKQVGIQVLFKWNDDQNNNMDNQTDTLYKGQENPKDPVHELLKYKVKLRFIQDYNK